MSGSDANPPPTAPQSLRRLRAVQVGLEPGLQLVQRHLAVDEQHRDGLGHPPVEQRRTARGGERDAQTDVRLPDP